MDAEAADRTGGEFNIHIRNAGLMPGAVRVLMQSALTIARPS